MHRRKVAVLDRCARVMRRAETNKGELTVMQVENVRKGRKLLYSFVRDLLSSKPKFANVIRRTLKDVHPRTEYCTSMLIRDTADICVTLTRVEQGRRRSDGKKHVDALLLLEILKDELKGNP